MSSATAPDTTAEAHPHKFWLFLNSQFGLWIMSAIFLTGATSIYATLQARNLLETERLQAIEKLDFEISYRFSALLDELSDISKGHSVQRDGQVIQAVTDAEKQAAIDRTLSKLKERDSKNTALLFPEYKDHGFVALFAELYRRLEGAEKSDFEPYIAQTVSSEMLKTPTTNAEEAARKIRQWISPRWTKDPRRFFYLDCTRDTPFC